MTPTPASDEFANERAAIETFGDGHGHAPLLARIDALVAEKARLTEEWDSFQQAAIKWQLESGEKFNRALEAAEAEKARLLAALFDPPNSMRSPRIIDLCYIIFMHAKSGKNPDDGGPVDWFTDTRPLAEKWAAKLKAEALASLSPPPTTRGEGETATRGGT